MREREHESDFNPITAYAASSFGISSLGYSELSL
jgi:hypothetical protein